MRWFHRTKEPVVPVMHVHIPEMGLKHSITVEHKPRPKPIEMQAIVMSLTGRPYVMPTKRLYGNNGEMMQLDLATVANAFGDDPMVSMEVRFFYD